MEKKINLLYFKNELDVIKDAAIRSGDSIEYFIQDSSLALAKAVVKYDISLHQLTAVNLALFHGDTEEMELPKDIVDWIKDTPDAFEQLRKLQGDK